MVKTASSFVKMKDRANIAISPFQLECAVKCREKLTSMETLSIDTSRFALLR